ncbi:serine hydrolase domain-containing protein [Nocardioides jiangxiensis]|uniref:Serine hydrolase domain-containing protein n=1 Tax=Nocardioides jiangxiensis TaxID=3064524 RepID=A0ABT9B6T7_9ACTN|nr:serine hydrolase domain-containing protein [Nocardioides sp. WY-20]MDO7868848.1 serine hydrolase domain-containing protein [Nocardioides sp. WY-20]
MHAALTQLTRPFGTRVAVPRRLSPLTTVGDEVDPTTVGLRTDDVERIWKAVRAFYRTGLQPGMSLVVKHRGEVVVDRAIGHRRLGADDLITTDTPVCLYSCSKAISAVLVHRLVEEGGLALDDTVASHLPEFAVHGKEAVTVRDLLTHRARLARLPLRKPETDELLDIDRVVAALCDARLARSPRQAYHAVTGGYLLDAIVRRTGRSFPGLLEEYLAGPLDLPTMTYGVPEDRRDAVALSYWTGPTVVPPLTTVITRVLGVEPHKVPDGLNSPGAMSSVLPSAGIWASAHDAATVFEMLMRGGELAGTRVLSPGTYAEAVRPAGPLVMDGMLPVPIRFSAGFMLGEPTASLYGWNTPEAFGHLGFMNITCWADPARELSVAFLNTGKSASPEAVVRLAAVNWAISKAIPRTQA